jgi:hypothetical protein
MNSHTVAWIVAGVFLTFGLCGIAGAIQWHLKGKKSRSWPTAPGKVTVSELTEDIRTETDDNHRRTETKLYGAKIRYRYQVAGVAHESDRVFWADGGKSTGGGGARTLLAKYPLGHDVTVFYQPGDPTTAVLEPSTVKGVVMTAVFAVGFTAFGMIFLGLALGS